MTLCPEQVRLPGQERTYGDVLRFMQPFGGQVVLDREFPADLFLARAHECPPASGTLPGAARYCHANAARFATLGHGQHVTGLALAYGLWVPHSWIERHGQTFETTPIIRDRYVGFPLTPERNSMSNAERLQREIERLTALAQTQTGEERECTEMHLHDLQEELRELEDDQGAVYPSEAGYVVHEYGQPARLLREGELD